MEYDEIKLGSSWAPGRLCRLKSMQYSFMALIMCHSLHDVQGSAICEHGARDVLKSEARAC